jgi:ribonuclease VapC
MIVDSSAILAIALQEPEAARLASAIVHAPERHISRVNWLETMMVIESRAGIAAADDMLLIFGQLGIETLPFDAAHLHEAHEAWRRYGKGRRPASLNLGDCCAYATSRIEGRPLLFKGNDFEKTDVAKTSWQR